MTAPLTPKAATLLTEIQALYKQKDERLEKFAKAAEASLEFVKYLETQNTDVVLKAQPLAERMIKTTKQLKQDCELDASMVGKKTFAYLTTEKGDAQTLAEALYPDKERQFEYKIRLIMAYIIAAKQLYPEDQ